MLLKRGDRVRHPEWGTGVVQRRLVPRGVRVLFHDSPHMPRRLKHSELELLVDEPRAEMPVKHRSDGVPAGIPILDTIPERRTTPAPVVGTCLEQDDAWQTLEALRLGVVPARGIRDYTVAREPELSNIAALLREGSGCRVLWGDYGAGKTHMLEAAEQLALEQGFAVARITLDPSENALHHPLRLYRHIAESVRTLDQVTEGFESLFEKLEASPDHYRFDGAQASRFFSPYLHALRKGSAEDIGWLRDYVRGDNIGSEEVNRVLWRLSWFGERALRMPDFRTYGRMYVHLVGTLACWCEDAGARGLVLLFDEVERVEALRFEDQQYAFEVLRHYAAVTMDPEDLSFEPELLYKGGQQVHRKLPLLFRDSQPLISIFALTPLDEIREQFESLTSSTAYDVYLAPLEPSCLRELVKKIAALYERAYPGHEVASAARDFAHRRISEAHGGGHDSFRDAVRSTVFLLDADRFGSPDLGTG